MSNVKWLCGAPVGGQMSNVKCQMPVRGSGGGQMSNVKCQTWPLLLLLRLMLLLC